MKCERRTAEKGKRKEYKEGKDKERKWKQQN